MRVVLLKGVSAYGAARIFVDELAQAFAARGLEPHVVDLVGEPDIYAALHRAAAEASDTLLVHSFGVGGDFRDVQGRSVGAMFGAPHVLQLVDHPLTHAPMLQRADPGTAVLVVDPSHGDAIRSIWGQHRFAHVGFCPHAAAGAPAPLDSDPAAFAARRTVPIYFPGTLYRPETRPWASGHPTLRRVLDAATEVALGCEWIAPLDALDQVLDRLGLGAASPEFAPLRLGAGLVQEEVRKHRRWELLKAAAKAGLPVHVCGTGSEKHRYRFKSFSWGGEGSLAESLELMTRARVVLNVNANFGRGSHDRPLTALMCGAAPASDYSTFYAERFVEGRDMLLYRWMDLDAGMARLGALAGDPEAAWSMARNGQPKVVADHDWNARADLIVAAAAAAAAARPALRVAA